uniref:Uncharacterized protein n=1 Tax=Arundo donax TaxID=35708 RepID=A0A0A9GDC8_ARUDO
MRSRRSGRAGERWTGSPYTPPRSSGSARPTLAAQRSAHSIVTAASELLACCLVCAEGDVPRLNQCSCIA